MIIILFVVCCVDQNSRLQDRSSQLSKDAGTPKIDEPTSDLSKEEQKDYVPGEIIVRFKDTTDLQTIEAIQGELHLETIRVVSKPSLYLMKILNESSVEKMMEKLKHYKEVKYSEPNYVRSGF